MGVVAGFGVIERASMFPWESNHAVVAAGCLDGSQLVPSQLGWRRSQRMAARIKMRHCDWIGNLHIFVALRRFECCVLAERVGV